ncbi:hypothetical protein C1646_773874 [Rhizophagus diaphanus]|nr:hypothetical protein C1646_773874 [Rhizophagus diaphanus] [Rhizophagus sp. MUCL 43196]
MPPSLSKKEGSTRYFGHCEVIAVTAVSPYSHTEKQLNTNSNNFNSSNTQDSLSQIIQNFYKTDIKEKGPTIQNSINEVIFEEDLSIVVDDLVNLCFKEVNEGKEEIVTKQHVIGYINKHKLGSHEFYNWLLNNQNDPNSIYLLGYFNYHGIEINIDMKKAFKLFQKAANLENNTAQFDLAYMCMDGAVDKNYNKAFELSENLAKKGYPSGINLLGYCYENGIGTYTNMKKAFELFQKAANLKNNLAQYNLALMYEFGNGTKKDIHQAIYWYKESAEQGDTFAQEKLKKLLAE